MTQQISDKAKRPISNVTLPVAEGPETSSKVIQDGSSQDKLPRRNDVSRELVEWMLCQQQDVFLVL